MIDIGKYKMSIKCSKCDFNNSILLKQVKLKDVIICRGCKKNIQLSDYMNSYIITERAIINELQKLEDTMKSFSNITINL